MTPPILLCIACFWLAHSESFSQQNHDQQRQFHDSCVVIDLHNDVVQRLAAGEDIAIRTNQGHSDLPRFHDGGLDACFFSIWVPPDSRKLPYAAEATRQIDSVIAFVRRHSDRVGLALSTHDIEALAVAGKFAVLMGMEGGHPIGTDLDRIDHFYKLGVRYVTLTWNNSTSWASSARDEELPSAKGKRSGLTSFGRKAIRRMNHLGMLIDVSHVGKRTFWDVIKSTRKPIIASHSSSWSICPNRRNLTDDQILAIAKTGGAVFINFAPFFIDSTFTRRNNELVRRREAAYESLGKLRPRITAADSMTVEREFEAARNAIRPPLSVLVDHFEHVAKVAGTDHVGIGSDFDGIDITPADMDDVSFLPRLTAELLARGFSREDVRKILGGNLLRILNEVQPVRNHGK